MAEHPAFLILYTLLQWTWGLVQNLLGAFLFLFLNLKERGRRISYFHGALVCSWHLSGSMGLGMFIFFGNSSKDEASAHALKVHEFGHTIQSCILGPLYLFVIGLPSLAWANIPYFRTRRRTHHISYFVFYPEKWANAEGERYLRRPAPESRHF